MAGVRWRWGMLALTRWTALLQHTGLTCQLLMPETEDARSILAMDRPPGGLMACRGPRTIEALQLNRGEGQRCWLRVAAG